MSLPSRDHRLTAEAAAELTRRHRQTSPDQERGGAFHAGQVRALLAQPGCAALRCYHGMEESGAHNLVLVGETADGAAITDGVMLELRYPCPPYCGEGNLLNGYRGSPAAQRRPRAVPLSLPPRDHRITFRDAAEYTERYERSAAESDWGGTFHADQVTELLSQSDCVALRYYRGRDQEGRAQLILLGRDRDGADLIGGPILGVPFPCERFFEAAELVAGSVG